MADRSDPLAPLRALIAQWRETTGDRTADHFRDLCADELSALLPSLEAAWRSPQAQDKDPSR